MLPFTISDKSDTANTYKHSHRYTNLHTCCRRDTSSYNDDQTEHTTHDINSRYRPREYVCRQTGYTAQEHQYEHQHYLQLSKYDYLWLHQQQRQQLSQFHGIMLHQT